MRIKRITTTVVLGLWVSCSAISAWAQEAYQIFDSSGNVLSFQDVMKRTEGKSHIFFGERHDNPISHWLQLELVKALHVQVGDHFTIGAEMFEADDQLLIDEYFADQIRQKSFEDEARLWDNYQTDYKPIVEYAKAKKLRLIATNIPRRYANAVFYQGLEHLNQLTAEAQAYIAPLPIHIDTTLSAYREIRQMSGNGHQGTYMLEAQAVKDATMAYFILKHSDLKTVFLHLNGSYHSDRYQGILAFLTPQVKQQKILTITTVSQADVHTLDEKNKSLADVIICVDEDMTQTH